MESPEVAELDESRISDGLRRFTAELFDRFPELRAHATMERQQSDANWALVVRPVAPSGDPTTEVIIWAGGGEEPSLDFCGWHTHESVWGAEVEARDDRAALFELIAGIFADRFVACEELGGEGRHCCTLVDLSKSDALLDELTGAYSSGRARLRSWTGRLDREVCLEDLAAAPSSS